MLRDNHKYWQFKVVSIGSVSNKRGERLHSTVYGDLESQGCSLADLPEILDLNCLECEIVTAEQVLMPIYITICFGWGGDPEITEFESKTPIPSDYKKYIKNGLFVRLKTPIPARARNPEAITVLSEWLGGIEGPRYWGELEEQIHLLRACHEGRQALTLGFVTCQSQAIQRLSFSSGTVISKADEEIDVIWSNPAVDNLVNHMNFLGENERRKLYKQVVVQLKALLTDLKDEPFTLAVSFARDLHTCLLSNLYELVYRRVNGTLQVVAIVLTPIGWMQIRSPLLKSIGI